MEYIEEISLNLTQLKCTFCEVWNNKFQILGTDIEGFGKELAMEDEIMPFILNKIFYYDEISHTNQLHGNTF